MDFFFGELVYVKYIFMNTKGVCQIYHIIIIKDL